MSLLKIQNFEHLVKDTKTNAVVNTSKSEFQLYMKRRQERNKNGDKLENVFCKCNCTAGGWAFYNGWRFYSDKWS